MNEKKQTPLEMVTAYLDGTRNKINELKVELATTEENTSAHSALKIAIAELTSDYNSILKKI